jgi:hypothetical protein
MNRAARALSITLVAAAVLSACGLKSEVKDQLSSGQLGGGAGDLGGSTGGDGSLGTSGDGGVGATGGTTGVGSSGSTGTSGSTGFSSGGSTGTSGSSGTTSAGTSGTSGTTGVSSSGTTGAVSAKGTTTGIDQGKKTVAIALHGPLTGAGVPQTSFNSGTPNFTDAQDAMVNALVAAGAKGRSGAFSASNDVILTDKAPSNCSAQATTIRGGGYEVIYFLGQPSFFAQCVGSIGNVPINPVYTGPGPSFGISSVITLACGANTRYEGYFLHPSPSWNQRQKYGAPESLVDDIELGIWGAMQQLHQAFDATLAKGPLTRENFTSTLFSTGSKGGVFLPALFNGQTRFGGTAAYANAADCQNRLSNTIGVYRP